MPRTGNNLDESLEQSLERPVAESVSVGEGDDMAPLTESEKDAVLSPVSERWRELFEVDRKTLIRELREDLSIKALI